MTNRPLYLKHVGFVGKFTNGTLLLKDLVYQAGGAPVDNIAVFTHYIVVGNGGENTKLYKAWLKHIENGWLVPLSVEHLINIIEGKEKPPVPAENEKDTSPFAEQQQQLEIDVWQEKRDKFVQKYGLPDNRKSKGDGR
jgi:hypothetical protein